MGAKENTFKKVSRRKFLVRGGLGTIGVLAIGTYLFRNSIRRELLGLTSTLELPYTDNTDKPMVWFEVTKDNAILLYSPKFPWNKLRSYTRPLQQAI